MVHVCECSVMSDSLPPYGLQPASLLCPWGSAGKNIGVSCYFLLQGILPTQRSNLSLMHLLHWQADSLPLIFLGSLNREWYSRNKNFTMKQHKYSLIEILFNIIFACFVIFCRLSSFCVQFLSPLTEPVILVYQVSVSLGK